MPGELLKAGKERTLGLRFKRTKDRLQGVGLLPVGAPAAVTRLEEINTLGFTHYVYLGLCGGLSADLALGDILMVERAFSDEGTSKHYLEMEQPFTEPDRELTRKLRDRLEGAGLGYHYAPCWTTDAPYRETSSRVKFFKGLGANGVEMETSALFAVGHFRSIAVSALHFVSDLLTNEWKPAFNSRRMKTQMEEVAGAIAGLCYDDCL
jgi:uridine phosphorylase